MIPTRLMWTKSKYFGCFIACSRGEMGLNKLFLIGFPVFRGFLYSIPSVEGLGLGSPPYSWSGSPSTTGRSPS